MSYLTPEYIERIFTHHPPKSEDVVKKHEKVRAELKEIALRWVIDLPESPEKTIAIRRLQDAMHAANSAIAQNS